jgi:hypothetical protein
MLDAIQEFDYAGNDCDWRLVDLNQSEQVLNQDIKELDRVNKQIAKLLLKKESLTESIIATLGHEHEGQKTYEYSIYKLEVKTPVSLSLDKKKYSSGEFYLPPEFNPVKESTTVSYSIDKKLYDNCLSRAPKDVISALSKLIDKKPGNKSITIKERC